jgi:hypothetical protein
MSSAAAEGFHPTAGWRAREVEQELPELALLTTEAEVARSGSLEGDTPPEIQRRHRDLHKRIRGDNTSAVRRQPVPAATACSSVTSASIPTWCTPIEAAVLERMLRGGAVRRAAVRCVADRADDTGCRCGRSRRSAEGPLGTRASAAQERLGRSLEAPELPAGRLVVADGSAPLAVLFGQLAPGHEAAAHSRRVALFAVQVDGVPALYVEEALWNCRSALELR